MSPCDRSKGGDLLTNCRKRRPRRLVEAVLQRRRFQRNPRHLSQELSSAKTLLHFAFGYFAPSALHIGFPGAAPTLLNFFRTNLFQHLNRYAVRAPLIHLSPFSAQPTARSVSPIVRGRRAFVIKLPYVNDRLQMIKHKSEWRGGGER